jgi:transposase
LAALKNPAYHFKRIGLEAGPLSQWLFSALAEAELPAVCVETRCQTSTTEFHPYQRQRHAP